MVRVLWALSSLLLLGLVVAVGAQVLGLGWSTVPGPPETEKSVQLASSWRAMKHGAFRIACAPSGRLRLVLRARTPGPREYVHLGRADLGIFVNDDLDDLDVRAARTAVGQVDTIVSAELTEGQTARLVELFGVAEPQKVAIAIGSENMVFMSGNADGSDIRRLASEC